jgi:flagellar protein FliS
VDYRKVNLKQEYLKQSVLTASPSELIVMLFDACIKYIRLAEIDLTDHKNYSAANTHFINAQQIIMELINCLDTSIELATQLLEIYEFLLRTLRDMNVKKDLTLLPDVLSILVSMRDTWQQISKASYTVTSEVNVG